MAAHSEKAVRAVAVDAGNHEFACSPLREFAAAVAECSIQKNASTEQGGYN